MAWSVAQTGARTEETASHSQLHNTKWQHSLDKSSPAGKTNISQQKLTWILSYGSSTRALKGERVGLWLDLGL